MRRYSPPLTRTTAHLCAGIRPRRRAPRRFPPCQAIAGHGVFYGCHAGIRPHGVVVWGGGITHPVWANKTANSFAGIRPRMPRRYSPPDATPVFAHTGEEMVCAGIVRDGHMDATSVRANKTANSFAGIRPRMPRRYSPDGCAFVV